MKKLFLFAIVIAIISLVTSCSTELVSDVDPVHIWDENTNNMLEDIKNLSVEERGAYIQKVSPQLSKKVISLLKKYNKITGSSIIDSLVYYYGDSKEAQAYDKHGEIHKGHFKNRLIAFVWIQGDEEPYKVLIGCLNGVVSFIGKLDAVMSISQFTITKGDCLLNHISYEMSMALAEDFDLPITKKFMGDNYKKISLEEAKELRNETDQNLIVIKVFPGDIFHLTQGTMTRNGVVKHAKQ